jgi:hypothetical protein
VCSTTFVFKVQWGSIQILGDFHVQTGALWNRLTPGRDVARAHCARPRCLGVRVARSFEVPRLPRPRTFPRFPCLATPWSPRATRRLTLRGGPRVPRTKRTAGPSAAPSPRCVPTEAAAIPRPEFRHPFVTNKWVPLFKLRPSLSHETELYRRRHWQPPDEPPPPPSPSAIRSSQALS